MAMIKCPECERDVSTLAAACPHCGAPPLKRGSRGRAAGDAAPATQAPEIRRPFKIALGSVAVLVAVLVSAGVFKPAASEDQGRSEHAQAVRANQMARAAVPAYAAANGMTARQLAQALGTNESELTSWVGVFLVVNPHADPQVAVRDTIQMFQATANLAAEARQQAMQDRLMAGGSAK